MNRNPKVTSDLHATTSHFSGIPIFFRAKISLLLLSKSIFVFYNISSVWKQEKKVLSV